ncbi:MAG: hypothetical protein HY236_14080 [Acidobacteria bacterium]|nr:hypothetical protein [Acidobacteriota bacterium]
MMRQKRLAALYLGIVFLAGALFGSVAHGLYVQHTARASSPRENRDRYVARLKKDLDLTPEQVTKVIAISEETGKQMQDMREKMAPDFAAIREAHRQRIMAILTPDQVPKYQKIVEEHQRRHAEHESQHK